MARLEGSIIECPTIRKKPKMTTVKVRYIMEIVLATVGRNKFTVLMPLEWNPGDKYLIRSNNRFEMALTHT
jgi:hypothetical protein